MSACGRSSVVRCESLANVWKRLERAGGPAGLQQPLAGEKAGASMQQVRILLVDASVEFLDSAAHFLSLEPRLEVVGRTRCKLEAAELTVRLQPDLVLVDLGLAGLATAHRIKADAPAARVLL